MSVVGWRFVLGRLRWCLGLGLGSGCCFELWNLVRLPFRRRCRGLCSLVGDRFVVRVGRTWCVVCGCGWVVVQAAIGRCGRTSCRNGSIGSAIVFEE